MSCRHGELSFDYFFLTNHLFPACVLLLPVYQGTRNHTAAILSPVPKLSVCVFSPIFCAQRACGTLWGGRWSCHWGREWNWRSKQTRRRTEFWWVDPCCCQPASSSGQPGLFVFVSLKVLLWFSPERRQMSKLSQFSIYQEDFFDPHQC